MSNIVISMGSRVAAIVGVALFAALYFGSAQLQASDTATLEAFKSAIAKKYKEKENAFAQADYETVVTKFYSDDVVAAAPGEGGGGPSVQIGREQLRQLYKGLMEKNGPAKVTISSTNTFVSGDAGWDWTTFSVTAKGQPQMDLLVLFLWAKVNGEWICKGDFLVPGKFPS